MATFRELDSKILYLVYGFINILSILSTTNENEEVKKRWLDIHGMYLSLGHLYKLKSPYNSFYIQIINLMHGLILDITHF